MIIVGMSCLFVVLAGEIILGGSVGIPCLFCVVCACNDEISAINATCFMCVDRMECLKHLVFVANFLVF